MQQLTDMRLLIVDDNPLNVSLLEQVLERAGYIDVISTHDPSVAIQLCHDAAPDLLILDLHMPGLSGYDVIDAISDLMGAPENLPVLVLTADATTEAHHRALGAGARDFVTKPLDQTELLLRVRNLLHTRQLQKQLQNRNLLLGDEVRKRNRELRERNLELEQARLESLTVLASVGEFHDDDTHHHTRRVGDSAALIAQALGLPEDLTATIRDAAPLHDIGKIAVPRRILLKPGALTDDERGTMMRHVEVGAQILASAKSPVLRLAAAIAATHHERWDGRGYLMGLVGEQIPIAGRITAVADVFDALTHSRPYKAAWDVDRAVSEIGAQAGRQFDPSVVEAFMTLDPVASMDPQAGERLVRAA